MTALPAIILVVARARNGVIGRDGDLPWRLRSDLQRFKAITIGKPCIMGRKTWESLPLRPLPGRLNVVLTRDEGWGEDGQAKGALVCRTLDEAIEIARETAMDDGVDEICVIGGAGLFEAALPRAKRLHVTEVEAEEQELKLKNGVVFEDKISGGVIPREYIPSVETGARAAAVSYRMH